jgi:hypothetical protein
MKQLNQGQINSASFEMRDFATETGVSVEDFANYFYDVATALGYESDKFVELMESKFPKECADVILRIKVSEGW